MIDLIKLNVLFVVYEGHITLTLKHVLCLDYFVFNEFFKELKCTYYDVLPLFVLPLKLSFVTQQSQPLYSNV